MDDFALQFQQGEREEISNSGDQDHSGLPHTALNEADKYQASEGQYLRLREDLDMYVGSYPQNPEDLNDDLDDDFNADLD